MKKLVKKENSKGRTIDRRAFISRISALTGAVAIGAVATSCMHISEGIYTIDATKCTGCKDCFSSCKFNAISLSEDNVAVISASKCAGCGDCVRRCDEDAISLA